MIKTGSKTQTLMNIFAPRVLLVFLACLLCLGCEKNSTADEEEQNKPKVALIMKSLANEFFIDMAEGTRQHHSANPDRYQLIINGIKDESDLGQQVALVEQMQAIGVNAIVIAPADSKALVPVLKRAQQAGIVIVNIDNKLDANLLQDAGINIAFVGPDNRIGAGLVAEHLASNLAPSDEVAILTGIPTAFNAQQRLLGFEDAMHTAQIKIVDIQSADWQQTKASTIAAAMITEHVNLKAILCSNDNMAMGAIAAIKQAGKSAEIQVVGFDNISASQSLLENGSLLATVDQYGSQLAIFGVEYALEILNSGIIPADKNTPVDLITAEHFSKP